jgi:hypothetical protein
MKAPLLAAACALAATACNADQTAPANAVQPAVEAPLAASQGKPVELKSETPLLNWEVSWPEEVNAIPALEKSIRDPAEKALAELTKQARENKAEREKQGFDFNGYEYSVSVEVAGQTPRLLSLTRDWMDYAGGAHPNHGTDAILWDKDANTSIALVALLGGGAAAFEPLYRDAFCKALNAERATKREGLDAVSDPDDPFSLCPKFRELQIVPKGPEQGGPMTVLLFHADPYVAGPHVEGDYDIELPVSAAFIAALKPEYRSSFAAKR